MPFSIYHIDSYTVTNEFAHTIKVKITDLIKDFSIFILYKKPAPQRRLKPAARQRRQKGE